MKDNKLEMHYLRVVDDEMEKDFEEILKVVERGERKEEGEVKPVSSYGILETSNQKPQTGNLKGETSLQIIPRISKDHYIDKVEEMLKHIHRGDIYEANFCQEFLLKFLLLTRLRCFQG